MTTYALVGASDFNASQFAARARAGAFDKVIAVDGGFASLTAAGVAPDMALGDFDSLGFVPEGVPCAQFPPEKDASDMELALEHARREGADAVVVYGALGGRLDHTLANLQLLASFAERGMTVEAVGEGERIVFLVGPGELRIVDGEAGAGPAGRPEDAGAFRSLVVPAALDAGGVVSVFSLTDVSRGVREEGLKYGLDGVELTNRTSWGLSNELAGADARIALDCGTLAVFLPL